MNILISETERHPIEGGSLRKEEESKHFILVFGLGKRRGEKFVYSTRVTDPLFTVLQRHNLKLYTRQMEEGHGRMMHVINKNRAMSMDVILDFVGVSYDLRQTMSAEDYKTLITEICEAIDMNPPASDHTVPTEAPTNG